MGDYALLDEVGIGSQAVVYRAMDTRNSQEMVLKVPHRHLVDKPSDIERVLREAEIVSRMHHPNIVEVLDQGQEDGQCFITMEFMPISLRSLLAEEGMLDELECIRIALDVCSGLEEASRHGLVHRDIKPENIMLSGDSRARVADFGIALALTNTASRTATEDSPGTVRYMPPEQLRGDSTDTRSDLYALGLVMFESLTGTYFLDARGKPASDEAEDVASLLKRHRPYVSQDVMLIVKKALTEDREGRYQTPQAMRLDLERALKTQAPGEAPTILDGPRRRWPRVPRWVGLVAAIGALFIGVGAGGLTLFVAAESEPTAPPSVELLGFNTTTDGHQGAVPAGGELAACDPRVLVAWLRHRNMKPGETLSGEWFRNGLSRGTVKREVVEGTDTTWFSRPDPNLQGEYRFDLSYQNAEAEEVLGSWDFEVKCTPSFELLGFSNTNDNLEKLMPDGGSLEICGNDRLTTRLTIWIAHIDLMPDTGLLGKWYQDGTYQGDVHYESSNQTEEIWFDLNPPTPPRQPPDVL